MWPRRTGHRRARVLLARYFDRKSAQVSRASLTELALGEDVDGEDRFAGGKVKFDEGGTAILQLDYLWHNFDIIQLRNGEMPLYIGLGGNLVLQNTVEIAARLPVGISYIFDKRNVPIDIYLQAVPTLWFPNGGNSTFDVYGELGAHYYF